MKRKYSVAEIDQMRNVVALMVPERERPSDRVIEIEERLRTYMASGTEPDELECANDPFLIALAESAARFGSKGE
jgi:hypothetical protein